MKNKIILFDIDYTLFDVGKYREIVFNELQKLLPAVSNVRELAMQSYDEIRKDGWFEIKKFTRQFINHISTDIDEKMLESVWEYPDFLNRAVYPEAKEVLSKLEASGFILGIFSSGKTTFQKSKIAKIAHFFNEDHIHIHNLKNEKFPELIKKYDGQKIILVDDYIPVIEDAKKADAKITAIWIKRGRLAERVNPSTQNPPDFVIENLTQLLPIVLQNQ